MSLESVEAKRLRYSQAVETSPLLDLAENRKQETKPCYSTPAPIEITAHDEFDCRECEEGKREQHQL
jgi:hypothetical protein